MTQAGLTDLLTAAAERGHGLGAFNVFSIEHAEAIVAGAEAAGSAVVLQLSQNAVRYHGALLPIGLATLAIARASQVPAAVHLDHADDLELVEQAIELGFSSVMFDASRLPYAANVAATAEVVASRPPGRSGRRGGARRGRRQGRRARARRADPARRGEGVRRRDRGRCARGRGRHLARHGRAAYGGRPGIDHRLGMRCRSRWCCTGHPGSPTTSCAERSRAGMTKINMATHLNHVFTDSVRATLASKPELIDSRRYLGPARDAMAAEVARLLAAAQRLIVAYRSRASLRSVAWSTIGPG